jgi:hypothetical protein
LLCCWGSLRAGDGARAKGRGAASGPGGRMKAGNTGEVCEQGCSLMELVLAEDFHARDVLLPASERGFVLVESRLRHHHRSYPCT